MLEKMTVDDDNTIINNDSNFATNSLDNKNLKNEKKNEITNKAMII